MNKVSVDKVLARISKLNDNMMNSKNYDLSVGGFFKHEWDADGNLVLHITPTVMANYAIRGKQYISLDDATDEEISQDIERTTIVVYGVDRMDSDFTAIVKKLRSIAESAGENGEAYVDWHIKYGCCLEDAQNAVRGIQNCCGFIMSCIEAMQSWGNI